MLRSQLFTAFFLGVLVISAGSSADPTFDVASVKLNSAGRGREQVLVSPSGVSIRNAYLRFLIQWAYDVRRDQVLLPKALDGEKYDLVAKSANSASEAELRLMMRTLLAERFRLKFHREPRTIQVYDLVQKGKLRLTETKSDETKTETLSGRYVFRHTSMPQFAERLAELGAVDCPVIDRTGLQGSFDFALTFPAGKRPNAMAGSGSIFDIVEEQLGLRLELRKAPVDTIVVDFAEKFPVVE